MLQKSDCRESDKGTADKSVMGRVKGKQTMEEYAGASHMGSCYRPSVGRGGSRIQQDLMLQEREEWSGIIQPYYLTA